ncbi:unnamed protein product [Gongylonema pulchrum]|uniref:ditrans,polycis-polyprenyl diphosphate synthase [(2E,6E)-farnesyldiphosphate specific] n=1 Tax=Gongylonema pulchrum TaxID=637853 RepID=A0A183ES68_9BILA|nr:unnamed protein product [Gongylonema pulchrum]
MSDTEWFEPKVEEAWWHGLARRFLALGPIPRHIAFIMDGNRRYARKQKCSSFVDGHLKGFAQLMSVLEWCRQFEVKEVTVYALSLENFNRRETEVEDLLKLFERKLIQLLNKLFCHSECMYRIYSSG